MSDPGGRVRGVLSDPRTAIARRDLGALKREKTIVLALLIQLFVAAFSGFLVVGLTSLYDPGSTTGAGIEVGVSGTHETDLARIGVEQEGVTPVRFESRDAALATFHRGEIDAVVHTSSLELDFGSRVEVTATVPDGNVRTTVAVVQIRDLLTELERQERAVRSSSLSFQPIDQPEPRDASPYYGFTYTVLVPLLCFLPPFISGSISVDSLTEEMARDTLELLRASPVSLLDVVDGKAAAMVLIAPLQVLAWIGLLSVNGITVGNPHWLLLLVTAITAILVVLGSALALLTKRRRQAQLLYSVLALVGFGLAVGLPEHPATIVAKLSVASDTGLTRAHVLGAAVVAVVAYLALRASVARVDPETL